MDGCSSTTSSSWRWVSCISFWIYDHRCLRVVPLDGPQRAISILKIRLSNVSSISTNVMTHMNDRSGLYNSVKPMLSIYYYSINFCLSQFISPSHWYHLVSCGPAPLHPILTSKVIMRRNLNGCKWKHIKLHVAYVSICSAKHIWCFASYLWRKYSTLFRYISRLKALSETLGHLRGGCYPTGDLKTSKFRYDRREEIKCLARRSWQSSWSCEISWYFGVGRRSEADSDIYPLWTPVLSRPCIVLFLSLPHHVW